MVPNPQLCRTFSVSLYSPFTTPPYPGNMRSTGSGRGNFIDKLAEFEGAKARHGVGSRTRGIREHEVKLYDHCEYVFVDIPGFKDSKQIPLCSKRSKRRLVRHLKHFSPGSVGLERWAWMTHDQE
ncbi:hypothetical protein EDD15DRAFT_2374074 [Pisolithus albus]|nr:hypothetical protein EDD15DRAFT_2374074 [Pisolithus albus]